MRADGNGWVRMGRFKNECLCDVRYCRKEGLSVSLWVKLSSLDNGTKVLLGSDSSVVRNSTGMVIFQTIRKNKRVISSLVFMEKHKWKSWFSVEPDTWFYLTVTWKKSTGLRMYKDGYLMASRDMPKYKPYSPRKIDRKCAVSLSPPSALTPLAAYYDDLVIWNYELESRYILDVYKASFDPPTVRECQTLDGKTLDGYILDEDNIYELKGNYKISWKKIGGSGTTMSNYTNSRTFRITGLESSSEYEVEVQRNGSKNVLSRPSKTKCNTFVGVPLKPRHFRVREKASTYFLLQWGPPAEVYGNVKGYIISYRVDDFSNSGWIASFRADVHRSSLDQLQPFTDYIIKLVCRNDVEGGSEVFLRATTAEGVPDPPRRLRVALKRNSLVIKWREPLNTNGMIDYQVMVSVNDKTTTVCKNCGEYHKMNNVDQNTTYTFWAIAYNVNNDRFVSERSNNFTISTPSFTPSVPRSVEARVSSSGIEVVWKPSKFLRGNVDYKLLGLVNGRRNVFCTKCGLHYLLNNVKRNTIYWFWVIAYNVGKGYEGEESPTVVVNTALFVPDIPMSVVVNITSAGILISWKESRVPHGTVQYRLMGLQNGSRQVFCSECGLQYFLSNAEQNTNYSAWVIAYNVQNGYESSPSSVVYFHTPGPKPQVQPLENVVALDVQNSSVTVAWDPPKGLSENVVLGYKVTLYDTLTVLRIIRTPNRKFKFIKLNQFTKYYITVQVETKDGYGLPSVQLIIQTKDNDECLANENPCDEHADCINSAGSFFCSCMSGYVGDGTICEALPPHTTESDFCPEEMTRNITWDPIYRGHTDRKLCPNGTKGISTRKCIEGNDTKSFWADPNLSNCVSDWMSELDDKLADRSLNSTVIGDFFLNLLEENDKRGLYGGDVLKSVEVIDILYNNSKDNELDPEKTDSKTTENFVKNLVNITEKIVAPTTLKVWNDIPKDNRAQNGAFMVKSLENMVVNSAKIVNYSYIQNENIVVLFGDLANMGSGSDKTPLHAANVQLNSLKFPKFERRPINNTADRTSVAVIKYKTIGEILAPREQKASDNEDELVNTAVLSVTMDPPIPTPFKDPFEFLLENRKDGEFDKQKCVFYNNSRYPGFWSTNGCIVYNATADFTVCHCYHMTSFSVLMRWKDFELLDSHKLILDWMTRIGLIVSLIALGLAFVTFVCLPRPCGHNGSRCFNLCDQGYRPTYLKKVRSSIHTNLIFSLAAAEALFLWGIDKTEQQVTCYTVAALLHYLFLVAFHWMAAEGVILYLVLVKVFQRKSSKKDKRMFMVICWGFPAAIVCIALAVGYENYLHEKCCWLSIKHGLIWSFVGPALTIITVNLFFLCCTFRVMGKRNRLDKKDKQMAEKIRYWAKGAAIVTCLLGVTWVFGVFFVHSDSVAVAYLFNIFNVFQGLFIFIFHCLLDEKIRQQYYHVFCVVTHGRESRSPSHSSGTVKKERRRSTFNSWLWSVVPVKYQESKSDSLPTGAENTLKRLATSTHSLSHSPYIERKVQEIILGELRPRGMSSIYHDSDENIDNIPDKILTVKHAKTSTEEGLNIKGKTLDSHLEDYWISTLSRENSSDEFFQVPTTTREECMYEVKDWEEQQEIEAETNSLHEQDVRKLIVSNSTDTDSDCESDTDNECLEEYNKVKSVEDTNRDSTTNDLRCYRSIVPQIILSDYSKKNVTSAPKCYQMVKITDSSGTEIDPGKRVACATSV